MRDEVKEIVMARYPIPRKRYTPIGVIILNQSLQFCESEKARKKLLVENDIIDPE